MQRIRLTYARGDALRYTGHLDMQTVWERTIRRARLPLMYSQGFHPQPRINQACPLPLGMTSRMEIVDFWLDPDLTVSEIQAHLEPSLQPGIDCIEIEIVDNKAPALQTQVEASNYQATFLVPFDPAVLSAQVNSLNNSTTLIRTRREKQYDLRPLIQELKILQTINPLAPHLAMLLSARNGATGRPEEVISELGYDPLDMRFERVSLILEKDLTN